MQSQSISYFGLMSAKTGQMRVGQYNLVRLSSTRGNTLRTVAGGTDKTGNHYFLQEASCCIENMNNLTMNGHALAQSSDSPVVQVRVDQFFWLTR